jgi:MFS family permease
MEFEQWKSVLLVSFIPLLLLPLIYFFMPESIRFLAQKGEIEKAIAVLRRIELASGIMLADWSTESFPVTVSANANIRQLFSPKLAVMTMVVWQVYFGNLLVIYGLTTWLPTLLVGAGIPLVRSFGYTSLNHLGGAVGTLATGVTMDRFGCYPLPKAFRTLSGVAGDSTHLPIALWIAMMTRCVLAREWLMPFAP